MDARHSRHSMIACLAQLELAGRHADAAQLARQIADEQDAAALLPTTRLRQQLALRLAPPTAPVSSHALGAYHASLAI